MQLDHIFICTQRNAPAATHLQTLGLTEGSAKQHPGQGTANRRFFFHNAFLELLWEEDTHDTQNALTQPTRLYERLNPNNATVSPFGVCFRPGFHELAQPPFPHFDYRPLHLPADLKIQIAQPNLLTEPMWFYLGFGQRPDLLPHAKQQPLQHATNMQHITAVHIQSPVPTEQLSSNVQLIQTHTPVNLAYGEEHLMTVIFDNQQQGKKRDLRPELPLVLCW